MELQMFRLFHAVADAGSFSKAAVDLHYAQSNLSTKILQLEKELHVNLFYRTSRGVILTPKGKTLYRYACSLQALADEALQAMQDDESDVGSILSARLFVELSPEASPCLCSRGHRHNGGSS